MTDKTRKIIIEAITTTEFGEGPEWVELAYDEALVVLKKIKRLQALCIEHDLTCVRSYHPAEWGPADFVEDLRLAYGEISVTKDSWFLCDHPKHSDYDVESRGMTISDFENEVNNWGEGNLYLPQHMTELLKSSYEDSLVESTPE